MKPALGSVGVFVNCYGCNSAIARAHLDLTFNSAGNCNTHGWLNEKLCVNPKIDTISRHTSHDDRVLPQEDEVTRYRMRRKCLLKWALLLSAVVLLTFLTEIGGAILLLSVLLVHLAPKRFAYRKAVAVCTFVGMYLVVGLVLAPMLAPIAERVALPCFDTADPGLAALSPLTCLLNRNYVTPATASALHALSVDLQVTNPGTSVRYLDAAFPFDLGMPLLPHLSHGDGRKVDLAFFYLGDDLVYKSGLPPSPIGYWGFEQPPVGGLQLCTLDTLITLRWNMTWLQSLWPETGLDHARTRGMLQWLVGPGRSYGVEKILLEPHLESRLGLHSDLIRFQGCQAARHDDHLHVAFAN